MKLLTDWGFTKAGWRDGQRGEYWVVAQFVLLFGFVLLPVYQPPGLHLPFYALYVALAKTLILGFGGAYLIVRGVTDLGHSLTPLPYPRADGDLVQTGVYGMVRHPIYGGVVLIALAWAVLLVSLSHLLGAIALFVFFNAKAAQEEVWLKEKYPDYAEYQQRTKKLIPWIV